MSERRDPADFIRGNTALHEAPLIPEIRLHLATEIVPIWQMTEEELEKSGLPPPFWAFAWAGGQALARYILDNPAIVSGKSVLDFGAGSGLIGIAAVENRGWEVILVGDMCYERPLAERIEAWLRRLAGEGVEVLIGDPGRTYLPKSGMEKLVSYAVKTTRELEDTDVRNTSVWRLLPG